MGSTRLPGKVLMPLGGRAVLLRVIERIRRAQNSGTVVVATTTNEKDDAIVGLCRSVGELCFRGDEADVLSRFAECAQYHKADVVVRVTADCPLLSRGALDFAVSRLVERHMDYVEVQNLPRGFPSEAMRAGALQEAHRRATDAYDREHVTPYIFRNPERFRVDMPDAEAAERRSDLRLTLDTLDDYRLVSTIYDRLGDGVHDATLAELLGVIASDRELLSLAHGGR